MKKMFVIAFCILASCVLNAQSPGMLYTPFFRDPSGAQKQQGQVYRTTAYQLDYNGNYVKIPIKVTEIIFVYPSGERSQKLEVTAYYSYDERQWINCGYGGTVSECESYCLFGQDNGLEKMFMYKAQVSGRGIYGTIYFEL